MLNRSIVLEYPKLGGITIAIEPGKVMQKYVREHCMWFDTLLAEILPNSECAQATVKGIRECVNSNFNIDVELLDKMTTHCENHKTIARIEGLMTGYTWKNYWHFHAWSTLSDLTKLMGIAYLATTDTDEEYAPVCEQIRESFVQYSSRLADSRETALMAKAHPEQFHWATKDESFRLPEKDKMLEMAAKLGYLEEDRSRQRGYLEDLKYKLTDS